MREIEIFQIFEDEFDCSGICDKGLFYFGRTLEDGPPPKTCVKHFHDAVVENGHPFAVFSVIAGTICMLNLFMCILMLCRPLPDKVNINE